MGKEEIKAKRRKFWGGVADNSLAVGSGLLSVANNAMQASEIDPDYGFDAEVNNLRNAGTYGYSNYAQILGEMNDIRPVQRQSANDIRGMSTGQKLGSIGSGALSGASAGAVFGPWGAAAGAVLGAGISALGVRAGDEKARATAQIDNYNALTAGLDAEKNYESAIEGVAHKNAVQGAVRSVARGGSIRRQADIKEYASRVLGTPSTFYRPEHQYCKGGLKVKIRVK